MTATCNICGASDFGPGPGGRRSVTGDLPRCTSCGSLERHRAIRDTFERVTSCDCTDRNVLQFSPDPAVRKEWFGAHEVSVYEGENSLDLMAIDRPDGTYSIVIGNHVLEHVSDDRAAFREIFRVLKPDGFAFVSFPDPMRRSVTSDWGYPNWDDHGHFRKYGRDVIEKMGEELPAATILEYIAADPVTGVEDLVYFICKGGPITDQLLGVLPAGRVSIGSSPTEKVQ
ncbi:MAG: methyltransferase domain-containing protein [Planctomycetes bacterium]|nr:methyltransferase domain-containing protein [Planctomycetota bacterium]NOG53995.1 methyltransferase domain-containing protein [Planctomycetota bacterium]